jgi:hypothetical protein
MIFNLTMVRYQVRAMINLTDRQTLRSLTANRSCITTNICETLDRRHFDHARAGIACGRILSSPPTYGIIRQTNSLPNGRHLGKELVCLITCAREEVVSLPKEKPTEPLARERRMRALAGQQARSN